MPKPPNGSRRIAIRGWIVFYASLIHLTWGTTLLLEPGVMQVAPVSQIAGWFHFNHQFTSLMYFTAGALAWIGSTRLKYDLFGLILGVPQLLLILMGAAACLEVIFTGIHPDGSINRSWFFLAQLGSSVWLAPVYMLAVYSPYWKALWKQGR